MGKKIVLLVTPLLILLCYQACSRNLSFSPADDASSQPPTPLQETRLESGNGEGYSGKLTRYEYRDTQRPCREKSRLNQPLPNAQINSYSEGGTYLVRKECTDVSPEALNRDEVALTPVGDITYSGLIFKETPLPGEFDILAAQCGPVGLSPRVSPVRQNLIAESQNLLSLRHLRHPGIGVNSLGTLAGLPVFQISRIQTPVIEQWQRLTQDPVVQSGRRYVYSFFARRNPGDSAVLQSYKEGGAHEIRAIFSLNDGSAIVDRSVGVTNVITSVQNLEEGLFISTYFTSVEPGMINIGIAPAAPLLNAQLTATLIHLEDVSSFCGP
jgi:hypothetical protein